jgi:hypothetical protein
MLSQLKAIVAGAVGLVAIIAMSKFGFEITPEMQGVIVGAILYAVTYVVPNIDTSDPV